MMRYRTLGIMLVLGAGSACRGSTTGPDPSLVVVDGRTASFQGTDLTLLAFNLSWYPRDDSPMPASGDVFVTIQVEITNRSDAPRTISREALVLSSLDDGPDLHAGPRWRSSAEGRNPQIAEATLHPGETVSGWITYSVPIEELAEDLLWSPAEDLEFAIEIPWWGPERVTESRIFGTVRDANGTPLVGVPLTVSPLETIPGIPGAEATVGECTGTPKSVFEAVTDPTGTYELVVSWIHVTELCIDVHYATGSIHRAAGLVRPGGRGELAEIPELRLDLVIGD